jgi:hypothetical protein
MESSINQFRLVKHLPSLNWLLCVVIGHKDVETTLELGKMVTEKVQAIKCERCNRILVPLNQLKGASRSNGDRSRAASDYQESRTK